MNALTSAANVFMWENQKAKLQQERNKSKVNRRKEYAGRKMTERKASREQKRKKRDKMKLKFTDGRMFSFAIPKERKRERTMMRKEMRKKYQSKNEI